MGGWIIQPDRSISADATELRIEWLTKHYLKQIAIDGSGWETLYMDPGDGRLWEQTYPQSEMNGGGPRRLHVITADAATKKYGC